jgi:chorismate--pyruvate lyase
MTANKLSTLQPGIWLDHRQLSYQQLPASIRYWLLDTGSLTERLITASKGQFRVKVLSQIWTRPAADEAELLNLKPQEDALVRETALQCNNETWVFARSIIPSATLQGELRHLRNLQNNSLGALLFNDPSMQRAPFQVSQIPARQLPASLALDPTPELLWGRRSCFLLQNKALLVSEIFLPRFQPWPVST